MLNYVSRESYSVNGPRRLGKSCSVSTALASKAITLTDNSTNCPGPLNEMISKRYKLQVQKLQITHSLDSWAFSSLQRSAHWTCFQKSNLSGGFWGEDLAADCCSTEWFWMGLRNGSHYTCRHAASDRTVPRTSLRVLISKFLSSRFSAAAAPRWLFMCV